MADNVTCPLCGGANASRRTDHFGDTRIDFYSKDCCTPFVLRHPEQEWFNDPRYCTAEKRRKIITLIHERGLRTKDRAFLQVDPEVVYPDVPDTYSVYVPDLFNSWPETLVTRLERAMLNLAAIYPEPGTIFTLHAVGHPNEIMFAATDRERIFCERTLGDFGWVQPEAGGANAHGLVSYRQKAGRRSKN